MNVLFHVTTALSLAVILTDTQTHPPSAPMRRAIPLAMAAFVVGIASHGALDYIPHRYPVNNYLDVILGALIILLSLLFIRNAYRPIVTAACLGSILPDLVDVLPWVMRYQLGITWFPFTHFKVFPWHWGGHSGSLYEGHQLVSGINHVLLLFAIVSILYFRRRDLRTMVGNGAIEMPSW